MIQEEMEKIVNGYYLASYEMIWKYLNPQYEIKNKE